MAGVLRAAVSASARSDGGSPAAEALPPVPVLARLAAVVTLINVPIHVAWALGSTFLLPGGASIATLPQTRAVNAVVSGVLLAGAAVLFLVGGPWSWPRPGSGLLAGGGRVVPAVLLTALGTAAAVCLSHAVYGLVSKALFLAGLDTVRFPDIGDGWTPAEQHTAALLDVAVFEPWFLLEGVLLALAGWQYLRTARGRRRWVGLLSLATLALLLLGVLLALTGRRLAVG
jgi:hypothetical protein